MVELLGVDMVEVGYLVRKMNGAWW